jgi:hypothetical protein
MKRYLIYFIVILILFLFCFYLSFLQPTKCTELITDNTIVNTDYNINKDMLNGVVQSNMPITQKSSIKVYMTHYNLGVVAENDSTPCIGAESKTNLCNLVGSGAYVIALTSDQRKILNVGFRDKVYVSGKFGVKHVLIMDEMGKRFRTSCITKMGYCIKADWACYGGSECYSGPVTIWK